MFSFDNFYHFHHLRPLRMISFPRSAVIWLRSATAIRRRLDGWESPLFPDPQRVRLVTARRPRIGDDAAISRRTRPPEVARGPYPLESARSSKPQMGWFGHGRTTTVVDPGEGRPVKLRPIGPRRDGLRFGNSPPEVVGSDRVRLAGRRGRLFESAAMTGSASIVGTPEEGLRVVRWMSEGVGPVDVAGHPSSSSGGHGGATRGPGGGAFGGHALRADVGR